MQEFDVDSNSNPAPPTEFNELPDTIEVNGTDEKEEVVLGITNRETIYNVSREINYQNHEQGSC